MRVLVLCNSFRQSRYARLDHLRALLPGDRLEAVLIDAPIQVSGPPQWTLQQDGRRHSLGDFDLVVHWPVSFQERRARLGARVAAGKEYVQRSWVAFEEALLMSAPRILNPHGSAVAAANKAIALERAAGDGVPVPRFLISNDPQAIREFARTGPALIKILTDTNRVAAGEQFFPIRFEPELPDGALGVLPQLIQEEVQATRELRAYFFSGEVRLFAVARNPGNDVDTRLQMPEDMPWEPASHAEAEALTHRLASLFGLRFFSADFLEAPDGRLLFLDINPHAAWHWMGEPAARTLDAAFARALRAAADS